MIYTLNNKEYHFENSGHFSAWGFNYCVTYTQQLRLLGSETLNKHIQSVYKQTLFFRRQNIFSP